VYESGISTLINTDKLHDTFYKHLRVKILNTSTDEIKLSYQLNFITQSASKPFLLESILNYSNAKSKTITTCQTCLSSTIKLITQDDVQTIYDEPRHNKSVDFSNINKNVKDVKKI
jgi:hypothetical protein